MRLSTQLRRSVFALPLLAVAMVAAPGEARLAAPNPQAWSPAGDDCAAATRPVGARGLVRMPGDLSPFNRRLRCAT